jgi:single-strand DNA-binding protein
MSRSLNRVELLGHLGQDAEVKFTPNGTRVAQFSIATSRRWKPRDSQEWKEETDWHRCVLWKCEHVQDYLKKGKQVLVAGRLQTRSYDDRDGVKRYMTEVICEDLILLGGGDRGQQQGAAAASADGPGDHAPSDNEVPF